MTHLDDRATEIEIVVRSTDMDADRYVNNAVYFQYFEQSRLAHLTRWGVIEWPPAPDGGRARFALVQTAAQFRAPAVHGDRLAVRTHTVALSRRSFTLAYRIHRRPDGAPICEGSSVQVWLDGDGRATELPDGVRAALEQSLDPAIDLPTSR